MRILHTSDWHLGHQLYGYDRTEEQLDMMRQVRDIVADRKPDAFIISGDVFHVSQPASAVQQLFAEELLKIRDANPGMTMVVTAGNHDSASRHEIFQTPWKALGIDVVGALSIESPERHIITVPGKGYIIAVPYANERYLPDGFLQGLLDIANRRNREENEGRLPIVMTAHTTVRGADYRGHEKTAAPSPGDDPETAREEFFVGGIDAIDAKDIGTGYDYLALGHIHNAQFVHSGLADGHHRVRYSGTPLAVSFDETDTHSVSIVEIASHGDTPKVETVEIANIRPLKTLPEEGPADWETALEALGKFPKNEEAYIRLNVEQEATLPAGAREIALKTVAKKKALFCHINYRRLSDGKDGRKEGGTFTVDEFRRMDPMVVARQFLESKGIEFTDEISEALLEARSAARSNQ